MMVEKFLPGGLKPPEAQTPEDQAIILRLRAGFTVLFDRQDAHDMLLYAVLRKQGLHKNNLAVGATELAYNLERDLVKTIMQSVEAAAGGPPAPTLQ